MKKFLIICFILFFVLPANSTIITGEVEYNAQSAYQELSKIESFVPNKEFIQNHITDSNAYENLISILNGITELKDRKIAQFSDGSYGIIYKDDPLYSWYYKDGKLINFTQNTSLSYPCKMTKYKPDGSIINTGYKVSQNESYIFSNEGKLLGHWLNDKCFDENNNLIMTRKLQY